VEEAYKKERKTLLDKLDDLDNKSEIVVLLLQEKE
jgi:hypothetical protein